jgi:hypothetical protein
LHAAAEGLAVEIQKSRGGACGLTLRVGVAPTVAA